MARNRRAAMVALCPLVGKQRKSRFEGVRAALPHLRHRSNDEQTDNGHNFLRPRGRLNPRKKTGLAQRRRVSVGCAAASMRYHDEIRVFSRLMAKSVVVNNQ
jgi:hypothetical protein